MNSYQIKGINDVFLGNSIRTTIITNKLNAIIEVFYPILGEKETHDWYASLYKFVSEPHLCYFEFDTVELLLDYFRNNRKLFFTAIAAQSKQISHAVFSLIRPGSSWGKYEKLELNKPIDYSLFESVWHPEYQRYCEHVYNNLIGIVLFILGSKNSKNYLDQTLFKRVETLSQKKFSFLTKGCSPNIRNSISHGNVEFGYQSITYIDHSKIETLSPYEFGSLFDDLVDLCNSIVIACLIFLCEAQEDAQEFGVEKLPLAFLFLLIDGFVSTSDLSINSMVPMELPADEKRQLIITSQISTKSRSAQIYEGFNIVWEIVRLVRKSFTNFFLSFDSGMPVLESIILNGDRMFDAIENNEPVEICGEKIIETSLLWYDAKGYKQKNYMKFKLYKEGWKSIKRDFILNWDKNVNKLFKLRYGIVNIRNTSPDQFRRVEAYIYLKGIREIESEELIEIVTHMVSQIKKFRIKPMNTEGEFGRKRKPEFIIIKVFLKKRRMREYYSGSFKSKELVLIAEEISPKINVDPFYTKEIFQPIVRGNLRIRFNNSLIKKM